MSEKVKNRGWVKNVAIIFLAVMLVLTFFSNTIMNRSLPEVTGQSVQPGTITTQVRGDGRIEAAETYEVKSADSRKVQSVPVSVGQEVKVGDTLVVLAAGDSEELKNAQDALEAAQLAYQQALIEAGKTTSGDREIERAREKLQQAITTRDNTPVYTAEELSIAEENLAYITSALQEAKNELYAAGGYEEGAGSDALKALKKTMDEAETAYEAAQVRYVNELNFIKDLASYSERHSTQGVYASFEAYCDAIANAFADKEAVSVEYYFGEGASDPYFSQEQENIGMKGFPYESYSSYNKLPSTDVASIAASYNVVADARDAYYEAREAYYDGLEAAAPVNAELQKAVEDAEYAQQVAQNTRDTVKAGYDAYEQAIDNVIACQQALESLIAGQQTENLNLSKLSKDVADAQALVDELSAGETNEDGTVTGGTITSEVNGIVKAINVTAGGSTDPANAIMTIEVPDRGYTVSITVTADQASKVTVGDTAEIQTGYWGGSDLHGRLLGIRNVPGSQGAQASRLLVFEVTGEGVESGTQVSVSIGQRSQSYDLIVPNSAVRSDSNGSFVLMMTAKSSPLGTRYQATRVDVQVVASDDVNSAVTGAIVAYDYVITNSTAPIEDGMYVRLADNA